MYLYLVHQIYLNLYNIVKESQNIELNKDCIEILEYMIEKDDYVNLEELAKRYKITNRAIRYKIDKIEAFLINNGFGYFDKKYKRGKKVIYNVEITSN